MPSQPSGGLAKGMCAAPTTIQVTPTFQHEKTSMAMRSRPCLTICHYRMDPEFGWLHARLQS